MRASRTSHTFQGKKKIHIKAYRMLRRGRQTPKDPLEICDTARLVNGIRRVLQAGCVHCITAYYCVCRDVRQKRTRSKQKDRMFIGKRARARDTAPSQLNPCSVRPQINSRVMKAINTDAARTRLASENAHLYKSCKT